MISLAPKALAPSVLALGLAASSVQAVETPIYDELRAMRPTGRQLQVTDLTLERDVFRFHFEAGTFYFLPPVMERTVGAVFVGQGSYLLSPATEQERRHLAYVTSEKEFEVLKDEFDTLVLLFADDTFEELGLHGAPLEGSLDAKASAAFEQVLKWQKKDFQSNFHLRLLVDLANSPYSRAGCFMAFVDGKKHPPALAGIDPRGAQALSSAPLLGGEDTMFVVNHDIQGGIWYLSHRQGEVKAGRTTPYQPLVDAQHYEIDVRVEKDADVAGTTLVHFESLTPDLRVVPISLLPTLRVEKASYRLEGENETEWAEIGFVQGEEKEDANPVGLVFPEAIAKKTKVAVKLEYSGEEVLVDAGEKNFSVRARSSWYPNFGVFDDMATFDLTYRVPPGNEVISVGEPVESRMEGGLYVSVWKSTIPIRVAGFNYGRFKKLEQYDEAGKVNVIVYTNPGTPDIIREIDMLMRGNDGFGSGGVAAERSMTTETQVQGFSVNTASLAQTALADGVNASRVCTRYFGPLPQSHVAITQQSEWTFGQSWPSLIFMPYISFLNSTQRKDLGFGGAQDFINEVGYHEYAHQWWGHLIGWNSYRDQWLSEGLATFSAALVLQHAQGWDKYLEHWESSAENITSKFRGSPVANHEAGPISQGYRLASRRSPTAYQAMAYDKGGFVIHMLRMMMRDRSEDPDVHFIRMMHDFTSTWKDKSPSTDDFKQVVERHMLPPMNATGNGKMDWFFDQWVHGTDIPKYKHDLKVTKAGGKYRIRGTVEQSEVGDDFRVLMPLYVELKKGQYAQFGAVPMMGNSSREIDVEVDLPRKPRRALVNANFEVLARN